MSIKSFLKDHQANSSFDLNDFVQKSKKDKEIDSILGISITAGVTLGELMIDNKLEGQISDELYAGFKNLMGDKINSYEDVRSILLEKVELGENSVFGLINKIKGQLGENQFLSEANELGINASLADSGSQEAWDVAIENGGKMQFVQVKLYSDPNSVISEINKVTSKVADGDLLYNGVPIEQVDFAVPENIYEDVSEMVAEKGLDIEVFKFGLTADEGKDIVLSGIENIDIDSLFTDILGATIPTVALHSIANAFLVYKGAKEINSFLGDTALQSSISTLGASSGFLVERLLQKLAFVGGIPTLILVTSVSMATRAIISRIINRNNYVDWLTKENEKNQVLIDSFS